MKSTHPITYIYEVDGHTVGLTRRHVGTAYARNGNAGNPTEYFVWTAIVDGQTIATGGLRSRASAYEHARCSIQGIPYYDHPNYPGRWRNVRSWTLVADEMKSNYQRQVASKESS